MRSCADASGCGVVAGHILLYPMTDTATGSEILTLERSLTSSGSAHASRTASLLDELFRHNALMASAAALACPSSFDGSSIFTMGGIP